MPPMRNAEVLCLRSVRQQSIAEALVDTGSGWGEADHVTATASLARAILDHPSAPVPAIPIATLLDLINGPGLAGEYLCPLDTYPGPDALAMQGSRRYREQAATWSAKMKGRRIRLSLAADNTVRRWAAAAIAQGNQPARVLMRSTRRLLTGVAYLASAGYVPGKLQVDDPFAKAALSAWQAVEDQVPDFSSLRRDFWIDEEVFEAGVHPAAADLRRRIDHAFNHVFGQTDDVRTIVHHGFYFYTPIQWSFFRLLATMPTFRQIFIVHDDGANPAFQVWREFFKESFGMPRPTIVLSAMTPEVQTDGAAALEASLLGEYVDPQSLKTGVELVEYRSPAQFVRSIRADAPEDKDAAKTNPVLYAADTPTVERYVARLGSVVAGTEVDLAHLPVGAFLLGLFSCFRLGRDGETTVTIDEARLLDIAGSGYLPLPGARTLAPSDVSVFRRAMRFFRGCTRPDQWKTRAEHLLRLVISEVAPLGSRAGDDDDVTRLTKAGRNPLRLVPWADVSSDDAKLIAEAVDSVVDILMRLNEAQDQTLRGRLDFLRERLRSGMSVLPPSIRDQVQEKLDGFAVDVDGEVDVHCLSTAVSLLLGHSVDSETSINTEDDQGPVRDLRALDALGLGREARPLHLANLADGKFPSVVQVLPWPFSDGQIRGGMPAISAELLRARADHSTLSDLYLLWLALDGVEPGQKVRLSWVSDIAGETVNPSAVLGLFVEPETRSASVRDRAGGIAITHALTADIELEDIPRPVAAAVSTTADDVEAAVNALPQTVVGIAALCARRFVLQWSMGPSGAFQQDHHQAMLYGNVVGSLSHHGHLPEAAAKRVCTDLWRNMSEAERISSMTKRVVTPGGATPVWNFTLSGSKNGNSAHDIAYQIARGDRVLDPRRMADGERVFLPTPQVTDEMGKICENCAVRPRCAVWVAEREM